MNLKNGKVFTSKFVATGPSSYKKGIYRAAVSQKLRNTALGKLQDPSLPHHSHWLQYEPAKALSGDTFTLREDIVSCFQ